MFALHKIICIVTIILILILLFYIFISVVILCNTGNYTCNFMKF